MHARATLNGTTIAETDTYEFVEGNVYFPPSSIIDKDSVLQPSSLKTSCPWKGEGSYYDIHLADGKVTRDAAWYYPAPLEKAKHIKDYVAFYKTKVDVERDDDKPAHGSGSGSLVDKMKHIFHKS